jgi:hypothetical protein
LRLCAGGVAGRWGDQGVGVADLRVRRCCESEEGGELEKFAHKAGIRE